MPDNLIAFYVVTALVALIIGADKGGVGGMLGTLGVPLMTLIMPVGEAIALVLPILMFGDIFAVSAHWGHWRGGLLTRLLPGGLLGILAGTFVLVNVPSDLLRIALALLILLFVAYRLLEQRILRDLTYQPRGWHGVVAGAGAGLTSTIAHAGGPPITIYLLLQRLEPRTFVATAAFYFAILNLTKLPFYVAAGLFDLQRLLAIVWLLPLVPLGVWLGKRLSTRVPRLVFERLILGLLLLSAGLLLLEN